jgi:hypothetical protein
MSATVEPVPASKLYAATRVFELDTVTVTPVTLPPGMTFDNVATFTWTPTNAQLNTSPTFKATVSDTQGRTVTVGPTNITVTIGLIPTQVPIEVTFRLF